MTPPSDRAIRSNLFAGRKKDFPFYPMALLMNNNAKKEMKQ
jgi:hypothetical protein